MNHFAWILSALALSASATSGLANGTEPTTPAPTCPPGVQSCNIAGVFKGSNNAATNTLTNGNISNDVTGGNITSNGGNITGGQQTNTQTATQTQGDLTQSIGDQRGHTIGRQTATTTSGAASTNSGNITTRGGAGGRAVATGGQGGSSRSVSGVRNSGNSTNTVGNVNNIDASQRTTIKHAANTAAMIDMQGYGTGNCLGDTNPSGQFGASIQTFGWGVTANSMKASNVCAMLKIAGPRAALAYLAQMDRNAHRALVNNGLAVTRTEIEAQVRAEAEAERQKQRRASTQKLACPSGYDLTARQDGSMTCKLVGTPRQVAAPAPSANIPTCPTGSRWDGRGCWVPKR